MEFEKDFIAAKDRIVAVKNDDLELPNMPIDKAVAEAEELAVTAKGDKKSLSNAGLNFALVEDLPSIAGALRYSQAQWMSEYRDKEDAQKEWNEKWPEALGLKKELLHHFDYAYRETPDAKSWLSRIRKGSARTDTIQDLLELGLLGEKYTEPLQLINLDITLLTKSRETSHNMAHLLAEVNGHKDEDNQLKLMRDKAYTIMMVNVRAIRECGQYVFWKDADRKAKYISAYHNH